MKKSFKAYKAFDKNLKCRDLQYAIGKTYTHKGEIDPCKSGLHFCENPADVFNYYSFAPETRVCEVAILGEVKKQEDKGVTNKIKIVREIPKQELLELVNSGKENTGLRNSGHWNSGHWNSGNGNSGNGNSGLFNTEEPSVRLFNKQTKLLWNDERIQKALQYRVTLTEFIWFSQMNDAEKAANPKAESVGGYLKSIPYKEAWLNFWVNACGDTRKTFTDLPEFDANIFKEITGIDVKKKY